VYGDRPVYGNGDLPAPELRASDSALGAYLRAIKAHLVVFVLVSATALVAAGVWAVTREPQWGATARILVSPLEQTDRTFLGTPVIRDVSGDPTRMMQTAATLVDSREAATRTARTLGGGWTAGEVADAVKVQPEGESNVLAVRAQASDARDAARVATTFATAAIAVRDDALRKRIDQRLPGLRAQQRAVGNTTTPIGADLAVRITQLEGARTEGDPTLGLEEPAFVADLVGPRRSLVIVLALVAGLALGAAAAILLELTGERLRDAEEAERLFPLPVLARVPKLSRRARRAMSTQVLPSDHAVREAYRILSLQLDEGREEGHAVMLTSGSTGDGTTTSAIQLAVSLAQAGNDVILLDCALRSPQVHRRMGVPVRGDVLVTPGADLETALVPFRDLPLYVLSPGDMLRTPAEMEELRSRMPHVLAEARTIAHFVVVDTAPLGEVGDAIPLLRDVDDVIVVARPRHTQRASFQAMRDLIVRSGTRARGLLIIGATRHLPDLEPVAQYPRGPRGRRVRLRRGAEE
jgi:Mrp family chromosome partitioning ATPase